jgi:hypothetical protein
MPFQEISNHRGANPWWCTDKDMDMIDVRLQCQESQPMPFTAFHDRALRFLLYLTCQYLASVFGYPHEVISY